MKKVLIVVLCVVLACGVLVGCGGASDGALSMADFNIYENGKVVLKSTDFESAMESFNTLQQYDFEGRTLETKRGIKIGSSVREAAEAYKGIKSPMLSDNSLEKVSPLTLEEYLSLENKSQEYIAAFDMENGGKRYILNIHVNGNVIDNVSFLINDIG